MQFKIPQNVQLEDKIVGPVTLKQLVILGAGGGFDYFLYISLSKLLVLSLTLFFVIPIALLVLAIAFLKIQGLTFIQYVIASLEFYIKPRQRVWTQGGAEVFISITQPAPKTAAQLKQEKQQSNAPKDMSNLEELTKTLDSYSHFLSEDPNSSEK